MSDPLARAVIRTVHHLQGHDGPNKTWPTVNQIAEHLHADVGDVRKVLLALKTDRIFTVRTRRGERVWMPWDET